MTLFARVLDLLKARGAGDIHVIGGGIIPEDDADKLREMGVGAIFGPGTPTTAPIDYIKRWRAEKR
jgi:methylmalonyl-CoA mutase C-terminal domain/subunit